MHLDVVAERCHTNEFDVNALNELRSILNLSSTASSQAPALLSPPQRSASRSSRPPAAGRSGDGTLGRTPSTKLHRRRSSSIVLITRSSDGSLMTYSPPSRAMTRNPFVRMATRQHTNAQSDLEAKMITSRSPSPRAKQTGTLSPL
ncbi:hypothetical protein ACM66B_006421 [Microbotryomycetes sp. NB124-2]